MKVWIDRPDTSKIKHFERMVAELSPYLNELEIDQLVEFMEKISDSRWDINPSVEDSATQIKIILGSERYEMVKAQWSKNNQRHIQEGVTKYIRKSDGTVWDGLDETDDPLLYEKISM